MKQKILGNLKMKKQPPPSEGSKVTFGHNMRSPSGKSKNPPSTSKIDFSDSSDFSTDATYEDLLSSSHDKSSKIVDVDRLKSIAWKGIPFYYRPTVWRIFLDYEPSNTSLRAAALKHKRDDYFDCVERVFSESQRHLWTNSQKQTETQILKDLPRTHIQLLRNNERVQLLFERILFVWAVRHPASGYVQGMNDLLQPFFYVFLSEKLIDLHISQDSADIQQIQMTFEDIEHITSLDGLTNEAINEIEADCFWCFSKLLDGIQDMFTKDQPALYKMLDGLCSIINRVAPELAETIRSEEIQYQEFAFRWMNCLLVREFPMKLVLRLWDTYVCDPQKISMRHVYFCAAMMELLLQPYLKGLSHSDFVIRIQDPFMKQNSTGSISLTKSPASSPPSSPSFVDRDIHRSRSEGSDMSARPKSQTFPANRKLEKKKTCWDENDMEMVLAQAYVYERMFQASTHLKNPPK